tara:strand:+ start:345 stop:1055 length:711 start_codon:yes stop_codon:yes gene_type:complete
MQIKNILISHHPKISEMEFMRELQSGKFNREEILKSEIVELYRALNTREKIQNIYKEKLEEGKKKGLVNDQQLLIMNEVIDDEGETEEHIDHLDMRFKLFEGTPVKKGTMPEFNEELEEINNEWMNICKESSLFALMSCTCAIEGWYPAISKFFELEYKKRGFNEEELEIFIAHQGADIEHSDAQYEILEKNIANIDLDEVDNMVKRTFATSRGYERMKLKFANLDKPLSSFIKQN